MAGKTRRSHRRRRVVNPACLAEGRIHRAPNASIPGKRAFPSALGCGAPPKCRRIFGCLRHRKAQGPRICGAREPCPTPKIHASILPNSPCKIYPQQAHPGSERFRAFAVPWVCPERVRTRRFRVAPRATGPLRCRGNVRAASALSDCPNGAKTHQPGATPRETGSPPFIPPEGGIRRDTPMRRSQELAEACPGAVGMARLSRLQDPAEPYTRRGGVELENGASRTVGTSGTTAQGSRVAARNLGSGLPDP
mgnify:CR=1 FL=1|jgi:hypothetical protein